MKKQRQATWLELASSRYKTPDTPALDVRVQLHRQHDDECVALSVDGRPLVSSPGHLTVFKTVAAAERFLHLVGISEYRVVKDETGAVNCKDSVDCLQLTRAGLISIPPVQEASNGDGISGSRVA